MEIPVTTSPSGDKRVDWGTQRREAPTSQESPLPHQPPSATELLTTDLPGKSVLYPSLRAPRHAVADPAAQPLTDLLKLLEVDPSHGLHSTDAKERLQEHGKNELAGEKGVSPLKRFLSQFKSPLSLLLIPAAGLSAILGEVLDAIGIGIVSVLNATIGYAQESQAEKSMKALLSLSVREARVMRDGRTQTVPASELVPGDIIVLKQGDIVPADARLIDSADLQMDESALTGESAPVSKNPSAAVKNGAPLHEKKNMVFSGTGAKNGTAKAVVTSTGMKTEIGEIALKTQKAKPSKTPLEKDLDKVARQFLRLGGVSSVLIGLATGIATGSPLAAITTAISILVAVVPESLPTVTTLVLTNGVMNARKKNVLIRKLSAVETLGSTSVIATDKTGTLTTGEMEGKKIWTLSQGDEKWVMTGALLGNSTEKDQNGWVGNPTETAMMRFLESLPGLAIKNVKKSGDSVTLTVQFSDQVSQDFSLTAKEYSRIEELQKENKTAEAVTHISIAVRDRAKDYPFNSERKMHTMAFPASVLGEPSSITAPPSDGKGASQETTGRYISFTSGAAEKILERARLSDQQKEAIKKQNEKFAQEGYRVIALAYKRVDAPGETAGMEKDLTFSGLVAIQDPLRAGVKESMAELHQAGIKVMVITGDQVTTAAAIAEEAGILDPQKSRFLLSDELLDRINPASPDGKKALQEIVRKAEKADEIMISGKWIDLFQEKGSTSSDPKVIGVLPYDDFARLMPKARVLYRVEPRHKLRMIQTLQESGEIVAMTGDGVNDAPAIKKADIGIAMGKRGTNVTKEAADMILTDDSFNSIVNGVKTGRAIYANIRKFLSYIVSSNLGEIFAVGLSSVVGLVLKTGLAPILAPLQLLWINLVTDSAPALALAQVSYGQGSMVLETLETTRVSESQSCIHQRAEQTVSSRW